MGVRLAIAFLLVVCPAFLLSAETCYACWCDRNPSLQANFTRAELVFHARVSEGGGGNRRVKVERVWKGQVDQEIVWRLDLFRRVSSCDLNFGYISVGDEYLIFTDEKSYAAGSPFAMSTCNGTREMSVASAQEALGPGYAPKRGVRSFGVPLAVTILLDATPHLLVCSFIIFACRRIVNTIWDAQ